MLYAYLKELPVLKYCTEILLLLYIRICYIEDEPKCLLPNLVNFSLFNKCPIDAPLKL